MYILLGIVGEIATIVGSMVISLNGGLDSILEISKHGYKIDKKVLEGYQKREEKHNQEKNTGWNKALNTLLLLIPGVNLLGAEITSLKMKKSIMNDPQIKDALVPMTDSEKELYDTLERKMQKVSFSIFTSTKNEEEELFGFLGNRPIVVDRGLTILYYEELTPLAYTLDEVKKLNAATTYSYRIGKMDDKNVAIIGIKDSDKLVNRIQLKSEDYRMTHSFSQMSEEEAQDKTFIVYPYTEDKEEEIQKALEEIKIARKDSTAKSNSDSLQEQSILEQAFIPIEMEEVPIEEQKGPVYKKVINPKR